jgi:hypothetical protein
MMQLTLQEVLERIEKTYSSLKSGRRNPDARVASRSNASTTKHQSHRPEFYIPRIALRLANLRFSGSSE